MGLDDFSKDDSNRKDGSTNNSASDSVESGGSVDDEKDELCGLESFNTNTNRGGSTQNNDSDNKNDEVFGIPATEWARMTKKERIAAVRNSKIPDFQPEEQLDERWSYVQYIAINCVCGEIITFTTSGTCDECNRKYARENRTVVKKQDPEGVVIHDNAKDN